MPISGLVLTLQQPLAAQHAVLARLAADTRITVGEAHGMRLPIVTETESLGHAEELARELMDWEGVVFVDVVTVSLEEEGGIEVGSPRESDTVAERGR